MKTKVIAIAVIAFTAFSCNSAKQTQENMSTENKNATLTETSWELSKLEDKTIDQSKLEGDNINFTLNSVDKTVTGYSGCNFFRGTYTVTDNGNISFSPLASTRMACPDSIINESHLFKIFELTDTFTISGNTLSLNTAERVPLAIFTKSKIIDNPITEKYWKLKTLEGKDVVMVENQEREIYFILRTNENRIQGFSGCNTFTGNYTIEKGNRIRFNQVATTMKLCPNVEVNESEILNIFNIANNYIINGDTLTLSVGKRAPIAIFEAIYFK